MHFDWYQCTIEERNPHTVISSLNTLATKCASLRARPRCGGTRKRGTFFTRKLASLLPSFMGAMATSCTRTLPDPGPFSEVIRACWKGKHLVTRRDAAQDFNDPRAYARLRRIGKRIAKDKKLTFTSIEDRLDPYAGRTQYIGSPKSDYRCRIYEKGFEQAKKEAALWEKQGVDMYANGAPLVLNVETGEYIPAENWVRSELQVRARQEEGRRLLAELSPEQCWCVSLGSRIRQGSVKA